MHISLALMIKVAKMDDEEMLCRQVLMRINGGISLISNYAPTLLICSAVMDGVLLLLSFGQRKRLQAGAFILSFGLV
jgi:hypothetical protein